MQKERKTSLLIVYGTFLQCRFFVRLNSKWFVERVSLSAWPLKNRNLLTDSNITSQTDFCLHRCVLMKEIPSSIIIKLFKVLRVEGEA